MNINDLHLRELYRFAELGRMSASLLHEISNPLSAALINLEVSEPVHPSVRKARQNMQILHRYVEAARQQVRGHSSSTTFMVAPQIKQVKQVMLPLAKRSGVKLSFDSIPTCYQLHGCPVKFQQLVTNLITNAVQAYDRTESARPFVVIKLDCTDNVLTVGVHDWGEGIAPADLPKIFNMFYTTKGMSGHGLGLGLALTKHVVTNDFGGTITVTSSQRNGTHFTIRLPNCKGVM
jgi:two-component system C4-dicarboxylate transport sensor histidine kinase DctB